MFYYLGASNQLHTQSSTVISTLSRPVSSPPLGLRLAGANLGISMRMTTGGERVKPGIERESRGTRMQR